MAQIIFSEFIKKLINTFFENIYRTNNISKIHFMSSDIYFAKLKRVQLNMGYVTTSEPNSRKSELNLIFKIF